MPTRTIAAGEFKTHCLALMDELSTQGGEITITKRGKPVARLVPLAPVAEPWKLLLGTAHWEREEDIVGPEDGPWPGDDDDDSLWP